MVELLIVMAVAVLGAAILVPSFGALTRSQRAKAGAQIVETQLQTARLKAVATSRALRVRLSCPSTGTLRVLELTGVAATDNATNRCDPIAFPFPGPLDALRATPAVDGPVVYLPTGVSVSGPTMHFEFSPRGSVYAVSTTGTTTILSGDVSLSVIYGSWSRTVTVNALGRIKLV
jgi:Tfp pilus assembly protein FimT